MKKIHSLWKYMVCAAAVVLGTAACTDYDTPASIATGVATDSVRLEVTRRVLWVNIDGAVGSLVKQEVEQGNLPAIQRMLEHGKYSWLGLADSRSKVGRTEVTEEDPLTWASMLTGVDSQLHFIKSYSYSPDFSLSDNPLGEAVSYFPTVIQYLTKADDKLQTSCVTPWSNLNRYVGDANSTTTTTTDEETQTTLLKQLQEGNYRFTLASFKGVLDAGKQGGFTLDNANYVSALKAVDTYLEQLLATIDARENAYYDDWLVIVSSNHGGTPQGQYGGDTSSERDIFGLFYYPQYSQYEMKGEVIDAVYLPNSSREVAYAPDSTALYGIGAQKHFSLEMNLRMNPRSNGSYKGTNWNHMVGKKYWVMARDRESLSFRVTNKGSYALQQAVHGCNDAIWHAIYMGLGEVSGSKRKYLISYDGIRQMYDETECMGLEDDSTSVTMGGYGIPTSYYVASLRLWNEIMDDATVTGNASMLEVPDNHAYRKNLIGEWRFAPSEVVNDTVIPNRIKGMPDMIFHQKPAFVKMANTLPAKLKSGDLVMENTLIVPQIMYWLCGAASIDARLEGYNFLPLYAVEEQWRDYEAE